jgi:hypothetical protein
VAGGFHDSDVLSSDTAQVLDEPLGRASNVASVGRIAAQAWDAQQGIQLANESVGIVA